MAVAGQRGLDPRQVKAQEEFERMREQLTRTLERNVDPTPWRERARERVAAFERESARRRPVVPAVARSARWPWLVALGGAFALGLVTALVVALLMRPAPQPASDLAGIVVDAPAAEPPRPTPAAFAGQPALRPAVSRSTDADIAPVVAAPAALTDTTASDETVVTAEPEIAAAEPAGFEPALPEPEAAAPALTVAAADEAPVETTPAPAPAASPAASDELSDNPIVRRVAMIRESQSLLAALGYVPGRADGDPGPQTVSAAALFATERGLADSNLDLAFRAALREARAGALPIQSAAQAADPVLVRVGQVREIQALLLAQGFELGRADGDAGPATLDAAATFAETHGLADANLDAAFLAALRAASVGALD